MKRTILAAALALGLAACGPKPEEAKAADAATPGDASDAADAAAALSTSGFGDRSTPIANSQMKDFVENFEKVADIVVTVKDQAGAKAVGEQLRPIMAKLDEQSKAIDALPDGERAAASMQAGGRLVAAAGKLTTHMMSLPTDVQQTLSVELDGMPVPK